jgi:hypothetical protein
VAQAVRIAGVGLLNFLRIVDHDPIPKVLASVDEHVVIRMILIDVVGFDGLELEDQ